MSVLARVKRSVGALEHLAVTVVDGTTGAAAVVGGASLTQAASVDKSGTVTLGGTAQVLAAANTSRHSLTIQNNSVGDLWIRFGGTAAAVQPSWRLQPGDSWVEDGLAVDTGAVSVFGATTGQTWSAKEL